MRSSRHRLETVRHVRFALVVDVADRDAAIELARSFPAIEIRPLTDEPAVGAAPELVGEIVRLTPTIAADGPALRAIHASPAVAHYWDQPDPGFPMHDEPTATRFTIRVAGEIAGMVQFGEELEPKYRSASIDIFVGGPFQGRGVGSEAVGLVVEHLLGERGHHRITIDPAADNAAAIAAYRKAGFRAVGVLRRAERDSDGAGWHDSLLMELVRDP